ncbi:MAG: DUF1501 domain-containing protein, partial [Planctomycetes bacterium]|nr:DUF1501 domain-containing protein [Planctomycetota bacterium]
MPPPSRHVPSFASRRDFLARAGGGFGALALGCILAREGLGAQPAAGAAGPHHAPRARS